MSMPEPILYVCDVTRGIHEVHSDRVTEDVHVSSAFGELRRCRVLSEKPVDLATG
jgi:hypothetical protein